MDIDRDRAFGSIVDQEKSKTRSRIDQLFRSLRAISRRSPRKDDKRPTPSSDETQSSHVDYCDSRPCIPSSRPSGSIPVASAASLAPTNGLPPIQATLTEVYHYSSASAATIASDRPFPEREPDKGFRKMLCRGTSGPLNCIAADNDSRIRDVEEEDLLIEDTEGPSLRDLYADLSIQSFVSDMSKEDDQPQRPSSSQDRDLPRPDSFVLPPSVDDFLGVSLQSDRAQTRSFLPVSQRPVDSCTGPDPASLLTPPPSPKCNKSSFDNGPRPSSASLQSSPRHNVPHFNIYVTEYGEYLCLDDSPD